MSESKGAVGSNWHSSVYSFYRTNEIQEAAEVSTPCNFLRSIFNEFNGTCCCCRCCCRCCCCCSFNLASPFVDNIE